MLPRLIGELESEVSWLRNSLTAALATLEEFRTAIHAPEAGLNVRSRVSGSDFRGFGMSEYEYQFSPK